MYLPNPSITSGMWHKRSTAGLNSEFSFYQIGYLKKIRGPDLPNYLPTDGKKTASSMPLAQSEMPFCPSRGTVFISLDDNRYTMRVSIEFGCEMFWNQPDSYNSIIIIKKKAV